MPAAAVPNPLAAALTAAQQALFANARNAFESGELDYALSACETLLEARPECLPVRRLHYAALVRKTPRRAAWQHTLRETVFLLLQRGVALWKKSSRVQAGRSAQKNGAAEQFAQAERQLRAAPYHAPALRRMGEAATALAWHDTAVFAYEAISALAPEKKRADQLALGNALLATGRAADALEIADALLAQSPVDGDAQTLMRRAAIAQTMRHGNWEERSDFRTKLKTPTKGD